MDKQRDLDELKRLSKMTKEEQDEYYKTAFLKSSVDISEITKCKHEDIYLRSSGIWKCKNPKCGKVFY